MRRRDFLASSLALGGLALAGCDRTPAPAPRKRGDPIAWRNWSGYRSCMPALRTAPESLDQLVDLLRTAPGPVRPVGAGHSFSPLVPVDGGTILSLRNFEGLKRHDPSTLTATFGAGTKLGQLGGPLQGIGQAMPNMPDIDEQSLAGAIATATHGTGAKLGALHTGVTALTLVTPQGEVLECSATQHPEVFHAALVSLGSLGVVTEVTLQNVATHTLKREVRFESLDDLVDGRFAELAMRHHSFEMYLIPHCDRGVTIAIDPTDEPLRPRGADHDNNAVMDMKQLRDTLAWWPAARRWLINRATQDYPPEVAVDVWYRIFPSARAVRFNEMEYHLPFDELLSTVRKVRDQVETQHPEIFFPIEVRVVRGDDDALLSPFQGHEVSGSIAVHHYYPEDPLPYFASIEPILRAAGGRPHWGKMNTLAAADFAALYPRWKDFLRVRAELDPEGRMLNPYLQRVFGA